MTEELLSELGEQNAPEIEPAPPETEPAPSPAAPAPAEDRLRGHFESLMAQAEELRRELPDFDAGELLRDKELLRLTAPGLGVPLRSAYYALHREELERRAAERTAGLAARAVAENARRPREGGGRQGTGGFAADYRSLSRPEQQQFKQRILEAAARGEKIYP